MASQLLMTRGAGALIAEAKPVQGLVEGMELVDELTDSTMASTLRILRSFYGGLWVGGRLLVYDDHLLFEPNALNRAVHQDLPKIEIPMRDVTTVAWRRGFVTGIVDVTHGPTCISFRSYGSKDLAETIRAAAEAARKGRKAH